MTPLVRVFDPYRGAIPPCRVSAGNKTSVFWCFCPPPQTARETPITIPPNHGTLLPPLLLLLLRRYWKCNLGLFDGCVDYDMTCLGTEGMTEDLGLNTSTTSASTSTSIVSDAVVEDVATDESGAARKTFVVANVVVATTSALLAGIAAVGLRLG